MNSDKKDTKKYNKIKGYDLTIKNIFDYEKIGTALYDLCECFVFQLEKGDETGYEHYQVRLKTKNACTKHNLIDLLQKKLNCDIADVGYVSPTYNETFKSKNFNYVMKDDETKIAGAWTEHDFENHKPTFIPYDIELSLNTTNKFQKSIISSIEKHIENVKKISNKNCSSTDIDEYRLMKRKINILIDFTGNHGKSTLIEILRDYYKCIKLPCINDFKELTQACCNKLVDSNNRTPSGIFIDMPRCMEKNKLKGYFSAIEEIKQGMICDVRHKYTEWRFYSCPIWLMTNEVPEISYLSSDRWTFYTIDENNELINISYEEAIKLEIKYDSDNKSNNFLSKDEIKEKILNEMNNNLNFIDNPLDD